MGGRHPGGYHARVAVCSYAARLRSTGGRTLPSFALPACFTTTHLRPTLTRPPAATTQFLFLFNIDHLFFCLLFTMGNMKTRELTEKQILLVRCPTCDADPGKRCELSTGGLRFSPQRDRILSASDMVKRIPPSKKPATGN